ncbi:MAG: DUF3489 domain-containing protein [Alphaproteobacteria bacterium]
MDHKLTATQKSLLEIAAKCADRAIRWPDTLRGGARTKIITALTGAGLARNRKGTLVITDDGLRAVGIEPAAKAKRSVHPLKMEKPPRKVRADSKQGQMIAMLRRREGATIAEMVEALDWQAHTVRGAMAGALKKRLGLNVTSAKVEGRGRVYRIAD